MESVDMTDVFSEWSMRAVVSLMMVACALGCTTPTTADDDRTGWDGSFVDEADGYDLGYRFTTDVADAAAMNVEMVIAPSDRRTTELLIPSRWANVDDYHDGIVDIETPQDDVDVVDQEEEPPLVNVIRVEHPPGEPVVVRYRVEQRFDGDPGSDRFRPSFGDDYFEFIGHAAIAVPDVDHQIERSVLLSWEGIGEEALANSHGVGERRQSIDVDLRTLLHAFYLGGDFELIDADVDGAPVHIAVRDSLWEFEGDELAGHIARIIDELRRFFDDPGADRVLVMLIPFGECCNTSGTVLHNGVILQLHRDAKLDDIALQSMIAHEVFHLWNGEILRRVEPKQNYFWFSEGFTDFYAPRILLRAGMIDFAQYVELRNRTITEYKFSPARQASNEQLASGFWDSPALGQMPYLRGELFALYWDGAMRADDDIDQTVDDAMITLVEMARRDGSRFSTELLLEVVEPWWPQAAEQLQSVIIDGGDVELLDDALGPCASLQDVEVGPAEFGLDVEATLAADRIEGVDPEGPAYEAGLRDGQPVESIRVSIVSGIAVKPLDVAVESEDGEVIEASLMPDERETISLYAVDEERLDDDPDGCLQWFDGHGG